MKHRLASFHDAPWWSLPRALARLVPEVVGDAKGGFPGIEDFVLVSSGNEVYVTDGMDSDGLNFADDGLHVTNVWGALVSGPTDCGASCFDFEYGGNTITFRTQSSYDVVGDCIHYIGPVTQFGGTAQLDANDFDWYDYSSEFYGVTSAGCADYKEHFGLDAVHYTACSCSATCA